MKIKKIEAGERQLKTAIIMFFERKDLLAVHTVVGAASSLLCDIAKHKNIDSILRLSKLVRDNKRGKWISIINEPQNFLKHANKDPEGEFEFNSFVTEVLIVEGCLLLDNINGSMPIECWSFIAWFALKYPDEMFSDEFVALVNSASLPKGSFDDYELFLESIKRAQHT